MSALPVEERSLSVRLLGAPTHVLQFRLTGGDDSAERLYVVLIPGNPGVPGCYRQFAAAFLAAIAAGRRHHVDVQLDVVGHAGHAAEVLSPDERRSGAPVYSLDFQIQHKAAYLHRLLADDEAPPRRLLVVAHSIGCLIATKLAALPEFEPVAKFLFLMPTLHWLEDGLAPFIRHVAITPVGVPLLGHVVDRLPRGLLRAVVERKMSDVDHPEWQPLVVDSLCRTVVHNILYMARTEVRQVRELPVHLLSRDVLARIFFVFTPDNDSYTPPHLVADMVRQIPDAEVVRLPSFVPHAFVQCSQSIQHVSVLLVSYLEKEGLLRPSFGRL